MRVWDEDAARVARVRGRSLEEAVANWDRGLHAGLVEEARRLRRHVLDLFPLESWRDLTLDRYALGTGVDESFCKLMEFRTDVLGGIGGGSALKHLIYQRGDASWYFRPEYSSVEEAWTAIRAGFVRAFELAAEDHYDEIDDVAAIRPAVSLRGKAAYTYFPDRLVPVYAGSFQAHFYSLLSAQEAPTDGVGGSHALWQLIDKTGLFAGWDTIEIGRFLWAWSDPRTTKRIVKIAPGNDARFWDQCRDGGYVCVGWDEVGDLKQFESKEQFKQAFVNAFSDYSPSKATAKANELWTLMELQPGDIVVANQGIDRVVGIGEVAEPGYAWQPDASRPWGFHTVAVNWEDRPALDIDAIRKWATVTVAPVSGEEYRRILNAGADGDQPRSPQPAPSVPPDPLLGEIASTIERKGQVILYGPPGTGKTYTARRFSVWWLTQASAAQTTTSNVLGDPAAFRQVEQRLSTAQVERRVWWVVANPAQWPWSRLESEKLVTYHYGRLQRNYPLVQPGDLVVGYSAHPDKRIVALARVIKGLHTADGEQRIELGWLANVNGGPTYEELLEDPRLVQSEPMRFRNQGTLFALTQDEADYLLALLRERDPSLPLEQGEQGAISQLTRVTFHPSYGYEDFVEGYKPVPTGTGQLDLRLTDGVFKRVCRAAQADPLRPYLLLIDEINRGNIPKIFGELVTLLESDKRELTVVLPQSRETFSVPKNVFVVGTMNTADRSIKLLDAALRRRFAFIELMPSTDPLRGAFVADLDLASFLSNLNARIAKIEGREKQIGHSFLLRGNGEPVGSVEEFASRFRYEMLPLLQEYAYEDYKELESYIGRRLVNAPEQELRTDVLGDPQLLVDALVAEFQPSKDLAETEPAEAQSIDATESV
jgi:5-methylcytosine-specific restriction protein B